MNRPLLAACVGLALLAACDNVDKDGTAEKLIDDIERVQNITLDEAQERCVTDLVNDKSDDELRDLADAEGPQEDKDAFAAELEVCLRGTDAGTSDTAADPGTTTTVDPAATTTVDPAATTTVDPAATTTTP